jgi:hypothetical protein
MVKPFGSEKWKVMTFFLLQEKVWILKLKKKKKSLKFAEQVLVDVRIIVLGLYRYKNMQ